MTEQDLIGPVKHERQHFAHMASDDGQPRMLLERSGKGEPEYVDRDLRMPSEDPRTQQSASVARQAGLIAVKNRLRSKVRVDIDRNVKLRGPREDRRIARIVEKAPFGSAVDHHATETKLEDSSIESVGRRFRRADRKMSETGKTVRRLAWSPTAPER
jgi:hypothetical protein